MAKKSAISGEYLIQVEDSGSVVVWRIFDNVKATEEIGVKIHCHFMPVEYFIKRCKQSFDYIFFDPPFPYKFHEQLILEADKNGLLNKTGTILVHRPEEHFMPETIGNLVRKDQRVYGRSIVDFYGYSE